MRTNIKMTRLLSVLMKVILVLSLAACSNAVPESRFEPPVSSEENNGSDSAALTDGTGHPAGNEETVAPGPSEIAPPVQQPGDDKQERIKITVGDQELTATLLDNATADDLVEKLPLTIQMEDLYSREMCYHFPDELPADEAQTSGYEVGEIIYWPPRHSLVIMYAQNDERFNMQKVGRINSGVEIFEETGDVEVTFELLNE